MLVTSDQPQAFNPAVFEAPIPGFDPARAQLEFDPGCLNQLIQRHDRFSVWLRASPDEAFYSVRTSVQHWATDLESLPPGSPAWLVIEGHTKRFCLFVWRDAVMLTVWELKTRTFDGDFACDRAYFLHSEVALAKALREILEDARTGQRRRAQPIAA